MRWKTSLIAVAAAVLSAVTMTAGAMAHGGGHGGGGHGGGSFGGHGGLGGHGFGGHVAFAGRVGHSDHGRFTHFDRDRFGHFRFRRRFFFAGIGPGFYDGPYYDYGYGGCRVLTSRGWVWVCQ